MIDTQGDLPPGANLYAIWLTQRSQRSYQSLSPQDQTRVQEMLSVGLTKELATLPVTTLIERVNNRLVVA